MGPPKRWLVYKPYGVPINGTNILAFKVPLKETISQNIKLSDKFTPKLLMKAYPNLKYIIDLTNTTYYYDPKEFEMAGIRYAKVTIPGQVVPSKTCIEKFFKVMDNFRSSAKSGELIGVHCTHGINRTGYLICSYLVQQLGWDPRRSLQAFSKARGYSVERVTYVNDLIQNSHNIMPDVLINKEMDGDDPSGGWEMVHRRRHGKWKVPPLHQPFPCGPTPPRAFGPRPLMPPPPPVRWRDGPPSFGYGMVPIRPPAAGPYPNPRFPPRVPAPPGMLGPPRLPPSSVGPPTRFPRAGMPPPRLPPPRKLPPRLPPAAMGPPRLPPPCMGPPRPNAFRLAVPPPIPPPRFPHIPHHEHFHRNMTPNPPFQRQQIPISSNRPSIPKVNNLDFTTDTFEENLATTVCP